MNMTADTDPYLHLWPELELTLKWNPHFSLFFVFTKDANSTLRMMARLGRFFEVESTSFNIVRPKTMAGDKQNAYLFHQMFDMQNHDAKPCWLALDDGTLSERECASFMNALNMRRTPLEVTLNRPVFIALPIEYAPRVVDWSPDLWTIREQLLLPASTPILKS